MMDFLTRFAGNAFGFGASEPFYGPGLMIGYFLIVALLALLCSFWMLVDVLANEPTIEQKIFWSTLIVLLPVLGAMTYLLVRMGEERSPAVRRLTATREAHFGNPISTVAAH